MLKKILSILIFSLFSLNVFASGLSQDVESVISKFKNKEAQALVRKSFENKKIDAKQLETIANLEAGKQVVLASSDSNGKIIFVKGKEISKSIDENDRLSDLFDGYDYKASDNEVDNWILITDLSRFFIEETSKLLDEKNKK